MQYQELVQFDDYFTYNWKNDLFFTKGQFDNNGFRPVSICIRVTSRCNLRCKVCIGDVSAWDVHSDWRQTLNHLEIISRWNPLRVIWSGGEPTLHHKLLYLVEHSIDLGLHNVIASNMTIRDPLSKLNGKIVYNISLYGITESSYYRYTQNDLFKKFYINFNNLFDRGHCVYVTIILTHNYKNYLSSFLEWLTQFEIQKVVLTNLSKIGRQSLDMQPASKSDLISISKYLKQNNYGFPIVHPDPELFAQIRPGLIITQASSDNGTFGIVNQKVCPNKKSFIDEILSYASQNRFLHSLQSYSGI